LRAASRRGGGIVVEGIDIGVTAVLPHQREEVAAQIGTVRAVSHVTGNVETTAIGAVAGAVAGTVGITEAIITHTEQYTPVSRRSEPITDSSSETPPPEGAVRTHPVMPRSAKPNRNIHGSATRSSESCDALRARRMTGGAESVSFSFFSSYPLVFLCYTGIEQMFGRRRVS
jgi:hypothetical protein